MSLDAPTVAVAWTLLALRVARARVHYADLTVVGLGVWSVYVGDRLLDTTSTCANLQGDLTSWASRHHFHHKYRLEFTSVLTLSLCLLLGFLPLLPSTTLILYLIEAAGLCGYFSLVHGAPTILDRGYTLPKELMVGFFFSLGVFIPLFPAPSESRSVLISSLALFAVLCSLNCFFIYLWEHSHLHDAHLTTAYCVKRLSRITLLFICAALGLSLMGMELHDPLRSMLLPLACSGSGIALLALHRLRGKLPPLMLRASADASMLTPLIALACLGRH